MCFFYAQVTLVSDPLFQFFLQLLPDRKVLVCDTNYVRIYNVPESPTLAADDTPQTSPADAPVFTFSVADEEIIRGGLSALYFDQSNRRYISFATEGGICFNTRC